VILTCHCLCQYSDNHWFPRWLWCAIMKFALFPATVCYSPVCAKFVGEWAILQKFVGEWAILQRMHMKYIELYLYYIFFFFYNLYFATVRVYNQPSHVVTICVLIWHMLAARWMPASWTFRTTVSTRSSTRRGWMVHLGCCCHVFFKDPTFQSGHV